VSVAFGEVAGFPLDNAAREAAEHAAPPWYDATTGMLEPALWWIRATPYGIFRLQEAYADTDNAGKTPVGPGGQWDECRRIRDETVVRDWWTARPWCNIGVPTQANGLLVIDVDPRDGGVQSMRDLAEEAELDLATLPRQTSPRSDGGVHFFLRRPDDAPIVKCGSPLDGLDIPWQVPITPSLRNVEVGRDHRGQPLMAYRPYTWTAGDPRNLPVAPTKLIDVLAELGSVKGRLPSRKPSKSGRFAPMSLDVTELLETGIRHGRQNTTIQALATSMARRQVPYDEALDILRKILAKSEQDNRRRWTDEDLHGRGTPGTADWRPGIVYRAYQFIRQDRADEIARAQAFAKGLRASLSRR
jgi:hypothetical protein